MGKKVGNPVRPCPAGPLDDTAGAPVDQEKHKNCAIKILSIMEKDSGDGTDYAGGGSEVIVKSLSDPLVIKYEVKVCVMSVTLWVEFEPSNKAHADFYKTYEGNGVNKSRIVVIANGESKGQGVHEALWDGRDKTSDHRILLEGTYKVRIQGLHDVTKEDQTTIKFARPISSNFGIHYRNNSTKKEVEKARDAQKKLSDGTAFEADSSCSDTALSAWGQLMGSAVGVISGHSNPKGPTFYPEESTRGKSAKYKKTKRSFIVTQSRPNPMPKNVKADISNTIFLPEESPNSLRDMLLMVLAGCRGGNEIQLIQTRLKKLSKAFDPGRVDKKHGKKTTGALQAWQKWEHVEPADGTKNEATLKKLGIDSLLDERTQTGEAQRKLKDVSNRYNPGKVDGEWGDKTQAAITNYQQDHIPPLEVTGLPDSVTLKHLNPTGSMEGEVRNIAEAFVTQGCNISIAFVRSVGFKAAEKWHISFWNLAAQGSGIDDAASQARAMCGARYMKELAYSLYTHGGVDKNSKVHPARHGRDL